MPDSPADALLATDFGIDALYEAALDLGAPTDAWPKGPVGAELRDWLLARESDPTVARVLARARIRVRYRGPIPACVELVSDSLPLPAWRDFARAFRGELARALAARGRTAAPDVRASRRGRVLHLDVSLPSREVAFVTAEGPARGHTLERAAVAIDGRSARLRAANEAHVPLLTEVLGRALAGDPRAFRSAPILSLRPLQRGARALRVPESLRAAVARVRLIECEWDAGRAATVSFAGRDCPKEMARLGLHIEGGHLPFAVLRFDWVDGAPPTDVVLRPPNELACSDAARERTVRRFLSLRRVLSRRTPRRDLWSSEPWEESDAEARASYGAAFGELVAERVLLRGTARAVAHPDAPRSGRSLVAFPIPGEPGRWYGVPHGRRVEPTTLGEADLVTWKLATTALGRRVARALGLSGEVRAIARRGVIDLGTAALGPTYVRLFLLLRAPRTDAGLGEELRRRASPGHAVAVVPEGRTAKLGLVEVTLARVEGPYGGMLEEAARALGLTDALDPRRLAPAGTRLVVHRASRRVWLDGVLLEGLRDLAYRLVDWLAERKGATAASKEAALALSGGKDLDAMRRAKHLLLAAVTASFRAQGREPPQDVARIVERVRRGEVRLGVSVFVA